MWKIHRNRDICRHRIGNTGKDSRVHTLLDLFWMLLLSSEPGDVAAFQTRPKKSESLESQVSPLVKINADNRSRGLLPREL